MNVPRRPGRELHVGVALDEGCIVAALRHWGAAPDFTRALTPRDEAGDPWPDLATALADLRQACIDTSDATSASDDPSRSSAFLHVALMPPLAHLRRMELSGLRLAEALQVCRREPSRYLPVPGDAPPLKVEMEGTGWREQPPFTLVAANANLVARIGAAARESGWRVAEIVPAQSAWAASAASLLRHASGTLIVPLVDRIEIIGVRDRRVAWLRRLPAGSLEYAPLLVSVLEEAHAAPACVLGRCQLATDLRVLLARTTNVIDLPGDPASREEPAALAARFAPDAARPMLLPEAEQREAQRTAQRRSTARFAAAAALLVASGILAAWGSTRDVEDIAAARARLRPQVTRALAQRDSLSNASARLAALRRAATDAPRWSTLIASLATALPNDAFLLSMHLDADTLRLEGSAEHSVTVFEAMARVPALSAVYPAGPIRQEVQPDGGVRERFTLSAAIGRAQ